MSRRPLIRNLALSVLCLLYILLSLTTGFGLTPIVNASTRTASDGVTVFD